MIGARSIRLWVLIIFRSPKDLLTHLIGYLNDILPFKHRSSFFLNGTIVLFHVILSCLLVQGLLFLDDIIMVLQSNILFYNVIFQFRIIYFKVSFIFDGVISTVLAQLSAFLGLWRILSLKFVESFLFTFRSWAGFRGVFRYLHILWT